MTRSRRFADARREGRVRRLSVRRQSRPAALARADLRYGGRKTEGVGALQETLKWRQPSYLTPETKSGSTIRLDHIAKQPGRYALYFHCQSGLVDRFRELYPDSFEFEGKRALVFEAGRKLPEKPLRHCIALALTHHLRKKPWPNP